MLNLSLSELKLIAKSRGIKCYKSISEDRLLSALNASESVEESEYMPDTTKINKTIREIKENHDEDKRNKKDNTIEDKVLRDGRALFLI